MKNQNTKVIHSPKNHQCPSRRGDHQLWSTGILSPKKINKWKKEYLKKNHPGTTASSGLLEFRAKVEVQRATVDRHHWTHVFDS